MKTRTLYFLLTVLISTSSQFIYGQKSDFSGEWILDTERSVLSDNQIELSKITIKMKSDSLLTLRVYLSENGDEYPFAENLPLNGNECKIVIFDMPRKSKAYWSDKDGSLLFESIITYTGNYGTDEISMNENWKIDKESKILTIDYTNKSSSGEIRGTSYYKKAVKAR